MVVWFNLRLIQWNLIFCGWKIGDAIDRLEEKNRKSINLKCVCVFSISFRHFLWGVVDVLLCLQLRRAVNTSSPLRFIMLGKQKKLVKNRLEKIINSIPVITWSRLTLSSTWGRPHGASFFPSRNPPLLNYFVENGTELPDR